MSLENEIRRLVREEVARQIGYRGVAIPAYPTWAYPPYQPYYPGYVTTATGGAGGAVFASGGVSSEAANSASQFHNNPETAK